MCELLIIKPLFFLANYKPKESVIMGYLIQFHVYFFGPNVTKLVFIRTIKTN